MVANPMQKMKRNSTLLGVVIGLVVGLLICALVYMLLLQPAMETGTTNKSQTKTVAVLTKSIKSGAEITAADYEVRVVNGTNAPTDSIGGINGVGIAKIDLTAGTILATSMVTTSDSKLTNDLREQEYNMISLPTQLSVGDYIDVRLQLPDGGDYIVVSKKYVQKANTTTVWLNMTEEETLVMSNAIIEYYIMAGSKLYATTYTDPGTQQAATPTYCPNAEVADLISGNANITAIIESRYTDKLKSIRNSRINKQVSEYTDTKLENIETKIKEEIEKLQQSRESYFGALNAAQ